MSERENRGSRPEGKRLNNRNRRRGNTNRNANSAARPSNPTLHNPAVGPNTVSLPIVTELVRTSNGLNPNARDFVSSRGGNPRTAPNGLNRQRDARQANRERLYRVEDGEEQLEESIQAMDIHGVNLANNGQRAKNSNSSHVRGPKFKCSSTNLENNELTLRIKEELLKDIYECSICVDVIQRKSPIWQCDNCYSLLHMKCIKPWILKSAIEENYRLDKNNAENLPLTTINTNDPAYKKYERIPPKGWLIRCPNCQYEERKKTLPLYTCFCGKCSNPSVSMNVDSKAIITPEIVRSNQVICPHSCGEPCNRYSTARDQTKAGCEHACSLICHPGPCPSCNVLSQPLPCYCKRQRKALPCSVIMTNNPEYFKNERDGIVSFHKRNQKYHHEGIFSCEDICNKPLSCGIHYCQKTCHKGKCAPCNLKKNVSCACGKVVKDINCQDASFQCENVCGNLLDCKRHTCTLPCHKQKDSLTGESLCPPCELTLEKNLYCACKKTIQPPTFQRRFCTDPLFTCRKTCGKTRASCSHPCTETCHEGECPPCEELLSVPCRCGKTKQVKVICDDYTKNRKEVLCKNVCKALKTCKAHRCTEVCCVLSVANDVHFCLKECGKTLDCGKHKCDSFCHLGHCEPCKVFIRTPVTCSCGKTVIQPPVPCNTQLPECNNVCGKTLPGCEHPCHEKCHPGPCAPCKQVIQVECSGGHKKLLETLCNTKASKVYCSEICNKPLSCNVHTCQKPCHSGDCGKVCTNMCNRPRKHCDHICRMKCHGAKDCNNCVEEVKYFCECGLLERKTTCNDFLMKIIHNDLSSNEYVDEKNLPRVPCDSLCERLRDEETLRLKFYGPNQNQAVEDFFPDSLISLARSDVKLLQKLEENFATCIHQRRFSHRLMTLDAKRSVMAMNLACLYYGLDVQLESKTLPNSKVMISFIPGRSRIPFPLLSSVVMRTPDFSTIAKPVYCFRRSNVIRFAEDCAGIMIHNLPVQTTHDTIVSLLIDFRLPIYDLVESKQSPVLVHRKWTLHSHSSKSAKEMNIAAPIKETAGLLHGQFRIKWDNDSSIHIDTTDVNSAMELYRFAKHTLYSSLPYVSLYIPTILRHQIVLIDRDDFSLEQLGGSSSDDRDQSRSNMRRFSDDESDYMEELRSDNCNNSYNSSATLNGTHFPPVGSEEKDENALAVLQKERMDSGLGFHTITDPDLCHLRGDVYDDPCYNYDTRCMYLSSKMFDDRVVHRLEDIIIRSQKNKKRDKTDEMICFIPDFSLSSIFKDCGVDFSEFELTFPGEASEIIHLASATHIIKRCRAEAEGKNIAEMTSSIQKIWSSVITEITTIVETCQEKARRLREEGRGWKIVESKKTERESPPLSPKPVFSSFFPIGEQFNVDNYIIYFYTDRSTPVLALFSAKDTPKDIEISSNYKLFMDEYNLCVQKDCMLDRRRVDERRRGRFNWKETFVRLFSMNVIVIIRTMIWGKKRKAGKDFFDSRCANSFIMMKKIFDHKGFEVRNRQREFYLNLDQPRRQTALIYESLLVSSPLSWADHHSHCIAMNSLFKDELQENIYLSILVYLVLHCRKDSSDILETSLASSKSLKYNPTISSIWRSKMDRVEEIFCMRRTLKTSTELGFLSNVPLNLHYSNVSIFSETFLDECLYDPHHFERTIEAFPINAVEIINGRMRKIHDYFIMQYIFCAQVIWEDYVPLLVRYGMLRKLLWIDLVHRKICEEVFEKKNIPKVYSFKDEEKVVSGDLKVLEELLVSIKVYYHVYIKLIGDLSSCVYLIKTKQYEELAYRMPVDADEEAFVRSVSFVVDGTLAVPALAPPEHGMYRKSTVFPIPLTPLFNFESSYS